MASSTILRVVVFATICTACLIGVWVSYRFGSLALGSMGGILVAFVTALMLGAIVYVVGLLLFKEGPSSRSQPPVRSGVE